MATLRIEFDQIHQGQIAAELFITADPLIVGEEISAAIENKTPFEDLDRLHVMRRVAVDHVDTFLGQTMGKGDLFQRNVIAPIATPVNRRDQ